MVVAIKIEVGFKIEGYNGPGDMIEGDRGYANRICVEHECTQLSKR